MLHYKALKHINPRDGDIGTKVRRVGVNSRKLKQLAMSVFNTITAEKLVYQSLYETPKNTKPFLAPEKRRDIAQNSRRTLR